MGDFAFWIEQQLDLPELAQKISRIDFYMISLESVRHQIIKLCDEVLKKETRR
jgi:hypothetical protein